MIALLAAVEPEPKLMTDVYTCEHVGAMSRGPHTPPREDMVLTRSYVSRELGRWTVAWPNQKPTSVIAFDMIGEGIALKMTDFGGKVRKASYLQGDNIPSDGSKYAWLNFGESSHFEPPGYFCATQPIAKETTR